jgi:HNH endonuclease
MRVPDTLRFSILHRDGYACRFCGTRPPYRELQLDHVTTLADGGAPLDPDNLIVTCARCNNGHGDKSVETPDPVIGLYWNLGEYPVDEWVECSRFRIVQGEDGLYDLEAE